MPGPSRTLSESESAELLGRYGITVVEHRLAADPEAAAAAAAEVGFPVVAKLCGAGLAHKTERGLVRLDLPDAGAVETAAADLLEAATPGDGEVAVLVAPMVAHHRELIAGALHDAHFGPVVMLGLGGILAEALADVAFRLVPLSRRDALALLDDLEHQAVLGPFRGEPAVDRDAVADVLEGLARVLAEEPTVRSVDLNPLAVVDGRPVAVDALVEVQP